MPLHDFNIFNFKFFKSNTRTHTHVNICKVADKNTFRKKKSTNTQTYLNGCNMSTLEDFVDRKLSSR